MWVVNQRFDFRRLFTISLARKTFPVSVSRSPNARISTLGDRVGIVHNYIRLNPSGKEVSADAFAPPARAACASGLVL